MNFWQFIFFFLFVRNWHTGHLELSRPRMALFMVGLFLVFFGFTLVTIMGKPVQYETSAKETPTSALKTTKH